MLKDKEDAKERERLQKEEERLAKEEAKEKERLAKEEVKERERVQKEQERLQKEEEKRRKEEEKAERKRMEEEEKLVRAQIAEMAKKEQAPPKPVQKAVAANALTNFFTKASTQQKQKELTLSQKATTTAQNATSDDVEMKNEAAESQVKIRNFKFDIKWNHPHFKAPYIQKEETLAQKAKISFDLKYAAYV